MVLEFLGMNPGEYISEGDLENSPIRHLQEFLLEHRADGTDALSHIVCIS